MSRLSVGYARNTELDRLYWQMGKAYCDWMDPSVETYEESVEAHNRLREAIKVAQRIRNEARAETDPDRMLTDAEQEAWTRRVFTPTDDP